MTVAYGVPDTDINTVKQYDKDINEGRQRFTKIKNTKTIVYLSLLYVNGIAEANNISLFCFLVFFLLNLV